MSGNVFGEFFRVATYGESHGAAVGCVVDGCPARIPLTEADLQTQLDRRRPGQSRLTTPRAEADRAVILSGVENGLTLGTPIAVSVANAGARSGDYAALRDIPRPGHADYTTELKYGIRASSGGGRASARETIGRVAAGGVAEALLRIRCPFARIVAWVEQVGNVRMAPAEPASLERLTRADVDASPVRCPDPETAARMAEAIEAARADGDSLGGVAACLCTGFPAGLGEPVFDKLTATLAHAMMSIPSTRGFEIGGGFAAASLRGSEHNDAFEAAPGGGVRPSTNRAGGVLGGITTGKPIFFRVAFKPVPSIAKPQRTADFQGRPLELSVPGRHDPCVLPRAVPVIEAMAALVLADVLLAQAARTGSGNPFWTPSIISRSLTFRPASWIPGNGGRPGGLRSASCCSRMQSSRRWCRMCPAIWMWGMSDAPCSRPGSGSASSPRTIPAIMSWPNTAGSSSPAGAMRISRKCVCIRPI